MTRSWSKNYAVAMVGAMEEQLGFDESCHATMLPNGTSSPHKGRGTLSATSAPDAIGIW
jgi:hypothetical protein